MGVGEGCTETVEAGTRLDTAGAVRGAGVGSGDSFTVGATEESGENVNAGAGVGPAAARLTKGVRLLNGVKFTMGACVGETGVSAGCIGVSGVGRSFTRGATVAFD